MHGSNLMYPPIITNEGVFDGRIRFTRGPLHLQMNPMFSGSGGGTTGPPKPPKAPVKKPGKKKK